MSGVVQILEQEGEKRRERGGRERRGEKEEVGSRVEGVLRRGESRGANDRESRRNRWEKRRE